ncbi:MAG: helix-turn-helix domain-containing protein [Bacteroidales bacterium]|nr:helix-turn-helix domain-containing protein [Bacteroidales bacterium]
MDQNVIIGKNLKYLREISQFNQEHTADAIGVTRTAYANYELGIREMPYQALEKAADLFGCEAYMLFEDGIENRDEMLVGAFRLGNLTPEDMKQVMRFKNIVKTYLKLKRIANGKI